MRTIQASHKLDSLKRCLGAAARAAWELAQNPDILEVRTNIAIPGQYLQEGSLIAATSACHVEVWAQIDAERLNTKERVGAFIVITQTLAHCGFVAIERTNPTPSIQVEKSKEFYFL